MQIKQIEYDKYYKIYITLNNITKEISDDDVKEMYQYIKNNKISVIYENYYGDIEILTTYKEKRKNILEEQSLKDFPVLYLQGSSCKQHQLAGISLMGVIKKDLFCNYIKVEYIENQNVKVGTVIKYEKTEELYLMSIVGDEDCRKRKSFKEEMDSLYKNMVYLIEQHGFSQRDIYRTYFYLKDLLIDYAEFNNSREKYFRENFKEITWYPASTCIMGNSIYHDRAVSNIWAIKSENMDIVEVMHSGRQCEALDYKKLFSRGVLLTNMNKRCYISGTASIGETGDTLFIDDYKKQIDQTFECVQNLLRSKEMDFDKIVSCHAYLKKKEFESYFIEKMEIVSAQFFPVVCVIADVCRDDLLFEMDIVAEN
ncbi:Rid family hydrolase [Anaeromicropila populeti]|uniref:Enamine deaminase RidA, house cleaning of reactive enamine intermediates, YjgF/YER057c/UK114 family n=1 Tax=Anaeromicropila populeti TaxID=37658 RepID=A0A1I6LVL8_9FIRM|nr:Rid family hydrolase [Anaeromicropila populeti]SFS07493.1 Enamine deaminase RidA, house cleaning of reactive enamine intermediates, YjgF/YER057c/UK114 family [Anaeromicropila populeti]